MKCNYLLTGLDVVSPGILCVCVCVCVARDETLDVRTFAGLKKKKKKKKKVLYFFL